MVWYHDHLNAYKSKITPPKYLKNNLPQDTILKIIDSTPLDKAVCMTAPFGYGKTQTALQWLDKNDDFRCAFCCLDNSDNRMDLLLGSLTAAVLSAINPDSLNAGLLNYHKHLESPREFLYNAALSVKEAPVGYVLILKNIHCIKDPDALECLKDFIESILGHWKVLTITREQLPPVFNYLIMTGRIRPVTAEDLRLDVGQSGEFLKCGGLEADPADVERIYAKTQGWFAALNAVLTSSIEEHDLDYGDTAKSIIADYFETEIWRSLDDDTRTFLMKSSILDILDPSACRALTGAEDAKRVLNHLHTQGILVFLNEDGKYEYHPALKEFIYMKLENSKIDIDGLYVKYGWWLNDQKEYAAAFQCFSKVKCLYGIDRMLKEFNLALMPIEDFLDVVGTITSLDPNELKQYPIIVARMALVEYLIGNLERMRELKDIFLAWAKPGALPIDPDEYAEYYWEGGWLASIDPEETQHLNKQINDMVNFNDYAPKLQKQHDIWAAVMGFPSIFRGIKDYSEITGVIEPFIHAVDKNVQDLIRNEYSLMESRLILAEYYYETEKLTNAMEQIRMLMPAGIGLTHAKLFFCCIALLVKIMRTLGDTNEIGDMTALLERTIQEKNSIFLWPNYHAFLQRNYLADGNTGFLKEFYDENRNVIRNTHFYLLYRKVAYVRTLISMQKYHNALMILESLELLCEKYKRVVDLIEICVLKAIALYDLKDDVHAVSCLKKAYDIAKPYGYIRVFADDASELMPVLNLFRMENSESFLKKILISAKKSAFGNTTILQKNYHTDLTKTELKILRSLQRNLSYQEISMEHDIKMTTVKKHTQSIYGKLGARNRADAIAAAVRQGILKDS